MPREPDQIVRLAASGEVPDQVVGVVGDQVITATPADVGKVVTVAADGSLTLATGGGGGGVTDHGALTGLSDDDHAQYVLKSLIDAAGDLIVGTAADTAGRLAMPSSVLAGLRRNSGGTALEWSVPPGRLIGLTEYNPATRALPTTTSQTFADVDATNLAVPFVVPESGVVLVRSTLMCDMNTSGHTGCLNYRDSGGDIANTYSGVTNAPNALRVAYVRRIAGLTPGASKTIKLGFATTGNTFRVFVGGTAPSGASVGGAVVMEVFAA